ncbi:hypothetical protein [Pseudoalteromonas mariniglutinosa]|uniref:hypothetical protein n=1 Tax=Pseudoalteromonas mariniglutinosa TaxID=206042 RepID=UPI003850C1C7
MELAQDSHLTLPLFCFDDSLPQRDIDSPDLLLNVLLSDELLAQLCQNPAIDSSVAITLSDYQLTSVNERFTVNTEHSAQLTLAHGPLLSAVVSTSDDISFVSPQVDMMPTFDLGDEDENE